MSRSIVLIAAENGALPGGKVGGVADVIRGISTAMAQRGWSVTVLTPGYSRLSHGPDFALRREVTAEFRRESVTAQIHGSVKPGNVDHLVIEHPLLTGPEPGRIYYDDPPNEPFATDANRFSLFCALAGTWLLGEKSIDVIHLHDWHAAPLLLLRQFSPAFRALAERRFIFTIHNLAVQGVRPLRGHPSSLFEWFPNLAVDDRIIDPRWPDCVNLMRSAILLADRVNTVAPTYAKEILVSDRPEVGQHGGEGLEEDLGRVARTTGVVGVLNGCDYPGSLPGRRRSLASLLKIARQNVLDMASAERSAKSAHLIALERIAQLPRSRPRTLVTSVGRVSDQKLGLLKTQFRGMPVLHHVLTEMKGGLFILLGSGDAEIEAFLAHTCARFENFLFISGFSEELAADLYRSGKLFLMPSTFEPCGISQMLAMRSGQPCLVHAVGGLKDTVQENVNGWTFAGATIEEQCGNLLAAFTRAYAAAQDNAAAYRQLKKNAASTRYTWDDAAEEYSRLYTSEPDARTGA